MAPSGEFNPDNPEPQVMTSSDRILRLEIWRQGDRERFHEFEETVTAALGKMSAKLDVLIQRDAERVGKSDAVSGIFRNGLGPAVMVAIAAACCSDTAALSASWSLP